MRYKPGVWVLTALIATLCGLSVWAVKVYRSRPLAPAALLKRIPGGDGLVLYIDFASLRNAGILKMLSMPSVSQEPEYQLFVRKTEFDYTQDLDTAMVAFTPSGKYLLLAGRFDWNSLRAYVKGEGGQCYNSFCKLNGSTPDRRISFFPLRANLMAMAVSPDESAAIRLQSVAPGPEQEVPAGAPVWLSIPAAALRSRDALPSGTRMFVRTVENARSVTLAFFPEQQRLSAKLNVRCGSSEDARQMADQLAQTTRLLRDAIAREHGRPNPADLSGVLSSGSFRAEGDRVFGYWPIERSFVENLLGGG